MPLTPAPEAPNTDDPDNFDPEGDAFLAWMENNLVPELNALEANVEAKEATATAAASSASGSALSASNAATAAMGATGYMRRSSATLPIGTGAKAVTGLNSPSAASFANGDEITLISAADAEARMWGVASSVNAGAGTMTVTVASGDFAGSGSPASWIVIHRAFEGMLAATASEVLAVATSLKGITPRAWKTALTRFTLTDGAPVTGLSGLNGLDFFWTLGANRTLPQLTNTYPGARGTITAKQDGVGSRILAVHSSYVRRGGLGVLSTAAAAEDEIPYEVKTVDGSNNATRVVYDVIKAPS